MTTYITIADRILAEIISQGAAMPPIRTLSRQLGASYRTVWKATRLLASQGKLPRPAQPARSAAVDVPTQQTTAISRLSDTVRGRIHDGTYRVGDALPKFGYFVAAEGVAPNTVAGALQQLSIENMLHKRGKHWIVGPRPAASSPASLATFGSAPVVVFQFNRIVDWVSTFNNPHLAPFLSAIRTELNNRGIQLGLMLKGRPQDKNPLMVWGVDAAKQRIRELGGRYMGAIMMDLWPLQPAFSQWAELLADKGQRPVVFFDSTNTSPNLTRTGLSVHRRFYRCFFNEPQAVELALTHLVDAGHARIGFCTFGQKRGYDWMLRRLAVAEEIARKLHPALRIIPTELDEPFWQTNRISYDPAMATAAFQRRISRFAHLAATQTRSVEHCSEARLVAQQTRSIRRLLDNGVTAILAANDWMAQELRLWCAAAELRVPGDVSLVSFDNLPETEMVPISTVDFGFTRLGYLAAHALIGDVPIKSDRDGNIASRCTLINRGSVGRPRPRSRSRSNTTI